MIQCDFLSVGLLRVDLILNCPVLRLDLGIPFLQSFDQVEELVVLEAVFVFDKFLPLLHQFLIKLLIVQLEVVLGLSHVLFIVSR